MVVLLYINSCADPAQPISPRTYGTARDFVSSPLSSRNNVPSTPCRCGALFDSIFVLFTHTCAVPLRDSGWHKGKITDRPLSYAEALVRTGCVETIEATVRRRRLLFAGFIIRMWDERLPKLVLLLGR